MGWQASRISIHAPHARSDAKTSVKKYIAMRFQSTLLMRGATAVYDWCQRAGLISIHAPHARSDSAAQPPRRRLRFQSTLLMRGATRRLCSSKAGEKQISIHAPHARSDFHLVPLVPARDDFNPRSSCEERPHSCRLPSSLSDFNPRSSCEERLCHRHMMPARIQYFNPRSSCEERLALRQHTCFCIHFNPRSSCEERLKPPRMTLNNILFQSTLLMRGATICRELEQYKVWISIHAPHARSDAKARSWQAASIFQSTLLMRGATPAAVADLPTSPFQSTLLMRGATRLSCSSYGSTTISIHAPHARSDLLFRVVFRAFRFQSTLLMRGATGECQIQSTIYTRYFNPRSSCEERRGSSVITGIQKIFQSTLLMRGATAQYSPA